MSITQELPNYLQQSLRTLCCSQAQFKMMKELIEKVDLQTGETPIILSFNQLAETMEQEKIEHKRAYENFSDVLPNFILNHSKEEAECIIIDALLKDVRITTQHDAIDSAYRDMCEKRGRHIDPEVTEKLYQESQQLSSNLM